MAHPVVHWEIVGKDAARIQRFYTDLFEWNIDTTNPFNYGIVDTGGEGQRGRRLQRTCSSAEHRHSGVTPVVTRRATA